MTQQPLTEDAHARRILETVPASMRAEVARSLRAIQFTNWLSGWRDAQDARVKNAP